MGIGRRSFIKRFFGGLVALIGLTALDAFWFEKYIIDWTEYDLSENDQEPVTLIQLSDIHIKNINGSLLRIAEKVNTLNPDALLFTGDTVARKRHFHLLQPLLKLFDQHILKIVILGNKEYDSEILLEEFERIVKDNYGVVLVNQNYVLEKNNRRINLLGIDDLIGGNSDFMASLETVEDRSLDTVVLNHCPAYKKEIDALNQMENIPIKAIISGHTHGGQITFFGLKIYTPGGSGRYLRGWYKNSFSKMYVSKGIGTTVLPIRFFARAEATVFHV